MSCEESGWPQALSLAAAYRIELACERFEAEWRSGVRPELAAFLAEFEESPRTMLVRELVAIDLHWRRRAGEQPVIQDYRESLPDDAGAVRTAFEEHTSVMTPFSPANPATDTEASVRDTGGIEKVRPGYEILGQLGRGGMGVVYKAHDRGLSRIVALKMILSGAHAGSAERERFRWEAEAVARLQHPNIVQIYEVGEHEDVPYFALEFCGGGTLAGRLAGAPMSPREAARSAEILA
jgi:hypothetical protein